MKARRKLAGAYRQHQRIRDLLDELEWERRKGVIAALLPYSGDRRRPRAGTPIPVPAAYTASRRNLSLMIPKQREPLPSEQRLVDQAKAAQYPHLRTDIQNNRNPRGYS